MKLFLVMALTLATTAPAFAQPSTADCAETLPQLAKIITEKFPNVIRPDVIKWFVGLWRKKTDIFMYGRVEINIERSKKLTVQDAALRLCPQMDGSFYLYNANSPSEYATITISSPNRLNVSQGNGRLVKLEDAYLKVK